MVRFIPVLLCPFLFFSACDTTKETRENERGESSGVKEHPAAEIKLIPLLSSPEFPDAILNMNFPLEEETVAPGEVSFSYTVTNYRLGSQTPGNTLHLANSRKGQHIHMILNNGPYTAGHTPEFTEELVEGHYVVLSFLSRSYHESIKSPSAYVLRQFTVGDAPPGEAIDLSRPHMFYSRPKGRYAGEAARNVLLDFYLVNTELSEDGNVVRVTINGQPFVIRNWTAQVIQGMPMGQNTIKLELLGKDGQVIPGPYNQVERVVTLSP